MNNTRRLAVLASVAFMMLAPAPALAQPSRGAHDAHSNERNLAEAKSRFKVGLQLFEDGAYDAARVEFERSYELAPSYKILYNIGLVYHQQNEFVAALKTLRRYLAEGGAEVPDTRIAEVTRLIETLQPMIASATVVVNVPGADITVDDVVVGRSPLSVPILLNPGKRRIGARFEGRLPDAKAVSVASGDRINIDLVLQEPQKIIERKNVYVTPAIVSWSVTGAALVGAGIAGYFTSRAEDDLAAKKEENGGPELRSDLDSAAKRTKTLALVTDIAFGTALVAAAVSTYFTIKVATFKGGATDEGKERAQRGGMHLNVGLGGAALGGTF